VVTDFSELADAELDERVARICGWAPGSNARGRLLWRHPDVAGPSLEPEPFSTSLDACFAPRGPAEWMAGRGTWFDLNTARVIVDGPRVIRRAVLAKRVARALCEAFCALAEGQLEGTSEGETG
jgi:hypothetical protein